MLGPQPSTLNLDPPTLATPTTPNRPQILSDPAKRREYDSVDEFDDSLPQECRPEDFFKVFGPAFRRNARWSVDTNVPDVGDDTTSYADVEKFYDFWFTFK